MPEFSTPFMGNDNDTILTHEELIRAIRFSIASEFEAIQLYEQLEESIDNEDAQKLLHEIADDEKVHVGNFLHLLKLLSSDEEKHYKEGLEEAKEILSEKED
ncbi:MAG: hypothetical protein NC200_03305 [Candidatus Gastranaerophilales bacterium]|nr:hypothetical protein [Candidatus Gastranaerophilales bacterium]